MITRKRPNFPCYCRLFLFALICITIPYRCAASEEGENRVFPNEEAEPADAILYPFFILALGAISHRVLTRHFEWLPYTGFMFLLGIIIGVGTTKISGANHLLHESVVNFWLPIDSELLLVSFLPGLIYKDASGQNPHLFRVAFGQCVIFAFPMVLAGTFMTAAVAYYIFPYDWSFNLSLTFGSILSATDPVAVAALLEQVGAPPRLKVHIAGESLLNDGSAIVFFNIFSGLYLLELGVEGLGEEVNFPQGVKVFFRKSIGGALTGVFFGMGLITMWYLLNHRLEREENVTQVGATIALAYLCYFVAEVVWETSGVMSVVAMGVVTSSLGDTYVNDPKLMTDFLSIIEWILNTVLFSLGGLVWGSIIGNEDKEFPEREFTKRDWGYLFLLYVLLMVIRLFIFSCAYPLISRIGLGSSWKEVIFESYGGLRGAVGISLAIYLDNIVRANTTLPDISFALQTNKLFGFVGGIAFLTLMVNGVLAGPLLRRLGLTDTSDTRKRMVSCYLEHNRQHAIRGFVEILGERRFSKVNFAVIRAHVPFLKNCSRAEVIEAANIAFSIKEANESVENDTMIHLNGILSYIRKLDDIDDNPTTTNSQFYVDSTTRASTRESTRNPHGFRYLRAASVPTAIRGKNRDMTVHELRRLFLELVRAGYRKQIEDGELVDREFVVLALIESIELAGDSVERAERLNDWDYVFLVRYPSVYTLKFAQGAFGKHLGCENIARCCGLSEPIDADHVRVRLDTEKCLAFIRAHTMAQETMKEYFANDKMLEIVEKKIIEESEAQVAMAEAYIQRYDQEDVKLAISHKVCKILLNNSVKYFQSLVENGLLKDQEAMEFFEDIEKNLADIDICSLKKHPGEAESRHGTATALKYDIEIDDIKDCMHTDEMKSSETNAPTRNFTEMDDVKEVLYNAAADEKLTTDDNEPREVDTSEIEKIMGNSSETESGDENT